MFWKLIGVMLERHADTRCRACAKVIFAGDGYGRSEQVCAPCRS